MLKKIKQVKSPLKRLLLVAVATVFTFTIFSVIYKPKVHAQIFLTSGTTWTVPSDWSNSNNIIEVIGGGGGSGGGLSDSSGSGGEGGGGGGGGAYSKITNVTLSPGSTVSYAIGGAGTAGSAGLPATDGGAGGDTYLCNATTNCSSISGSSVVVGAKAGAGGAGGASSVPGAGGAGGAAASGIGSTKFNGGTGGTGGPTSGGAGGGGGGGGGTGGGTNVGNNGTTPTNSTHGNGGQGDGTSGGAGATGNSGTGGDGTEWDSSHGSGGGGAGGNGIGSGSGSPGGTGGNYGAAGGAGGGNGNKHGVGGAGAVGKQGMIRIVYTFTTQNNYRWRLDDGNETAGTSLASQNTAANVNYGTNVRLRISIANLGSSTTFSYRLEYATYDGGCGSWTAIPNSVTTEEFNMYNTANYTDQAASTNVSSGPGVITDPAGYSFTAGLLVKSPSNTATNQTLGAGNFSELEYAIQPNANASHASYCFRVTTSADTPLDSYANYPILNINYPPTTPVIYKPLNSATNVSRTPIYQLRSADLNLDYLRYVVEECPTNSFPCASGGYTYNESSSCWSAFDVQSGTAFSSRRGESYSTMAYCQTPTSDILSPNTTYYMRAKAIDPGGSNLYSAYSSVTTFTTGTLDINITGGTCIGGTGSSCASGSGATITGVKIGG